jgi:WD40 repeat protein
MERLLNNNHDEIDLPASIIVDLILPFVDRETWNNLILTNREIYKASTKIEPPWPRRKFLMDERVFDITFSSDGKYFFVQTIDIWINVWHKRIGPYAVLHLTNRPANRHFQITPMASSPTENLLVTASRAQFGAVLQFWDIASLSVVNEVLIPSVMATLVSCVFSPDGRLVACNDISSNSLYIYSASNAVCTKTIVTNGFVALCGFSPDSQTIVAGFHDRFIRVSDVAGGDDDTAFGDIRPWLPETLFTPCGRLPSSPRGQSLVIGTANANVCKLAQYQNSMWVVKDLQLSMEVNGLYFIFSPSGRLLAARHVDGVLALWDPVAGKLVQTLGECQHLTFLALSANRRMLAVADHRHVSFWPVGN